MIILAESILHAVNLKRFESETAPHDKAAAKLRRMIGIVVIRHFFGVFAGRADSPGRVRGRIRTLRVQGKEQDVLQSFGS